MNTENPTITVETTTAFGGLAGVGIDVYFHQENNTITITRSSWNIILIGLVLIAAIFVPLYVLGKEEIQLLLSGDFGGERFFIVFVTPLLVLVAFLFVKSTILRRPVAKVSRERQNIHYVHLGYADDEIPVTRVVSLSINIRHGMRHVEQFTRASTFALTVNLDNGNAIDIASHRIEGRMVQLRNDILKLLILKG